ncbi:hypothetical protein [Methylobacterium goesingense]|uniref:hypothetical protein n=1 Tax=Methylobacterium goesingense TaxID=243690 RepID=UPI0027960FAF|nr:hypothetical protein [Methylobacterium goesingense]
MEQPVVLTAAGFESGLGLGAIAIRRAGEAAPLGVVALHEDLDHARVAQVRPHTVDHGRFDGRQVDDPPVLTTTTLAVC